MENRVKRLKNIFENDGFDGFLITNLANMLYFSDFDGAAAMLVHSSGESTLFVYSVNYEAAMSDAKKCNVEMVKSNAKLVKKISEKIKNENFSKLAYDTMNVNMSLKLKNCLKDSFLFEEKNSYIWKLRRVKDSGELEKLRKAAEYTMKGMKTAFETIKPGLNEIEIAAEIEYAMRRNGSYGIAFDTIVASGPRSAYPHGGCGERKIKNGDLVVVDIGATYKNYRGDMTRTFVSGKHTPKQKRIYEVVKNAQEEAFQSICDKIKAVDVDQKARYIISTAGYGEQFVHGLGHGIGIEVHEQPVLNSISKDILQTNNVVTVEPGIYIVGFGGIRIEDTVVVKDEHATRLNYGLYNLELD